MLVYWNHRCLNFRRVLLILVLIFTVNIIYAFAFIGLKNEVQGLYTLKNKYILELYSSIRYALNAVLFGFYPLAGFLADTKLGRFKTITRSSECLLSLLFLGYICAFILLSLSSLWGAERMMAIGSIFDWIFIPVEITLVMFNANIIQFGVDQLQDSPADHQSLFIHWYVWLYYLTILMVQIFIQFFISVNIGYLVQLPVLVLHVICIVTLCAVLTIVHFKNHWFIIDTARTNPYKLVYRVTKFARQHKVPIRRSAFTYCEDDIPSGLDLGKSKYGGPFTTEQVENVKAFYGILKVLFAFGLTLFLDYTSGYWSTDFFQPVVLTQIVRKNIISSSVIVTGIPIFIIFVRPFINIFYLSMLKRIGVGALVLILSVTCSFVAITVNYKTSLHTNDTKTCILDNDIYAINFTTASHSITSIAFLLQQCLYALSAMFLYPALYEFICAQSPHAMKGMLIGLSFAIRGLFQLLGFALNIPFLFIKNHFLSCAIDFYILTIAVGVVGLAVYVYVARKYKLRERDEPCHVRRFVEEYYSKLQAEENYD